MSESRFSLESDADHPANEPCVHCETELHPEVRFCFECGAPVVLSLRLPAAPASAEEELPTATFSAIKMPVVEDDLTPGEPIEIESLGLDVVVEEVRIELDEEAAEEVPGRVADPMGTVVAIAPERPMPYWPAPPKGNTVVGKPPKRSSP